MARSCRVSLDAPPLTLTTKDIGSMFFLLKVHEPIYFSCQIYLIVLLIALNIVVSLWTNCVAFSGCDPPVEKHRYKPHIVHISHWSPFTLACWAWMSNVTLSCKGEGLRGVSDSSQPLLFTSCFYSLSEAHSQLYKHLCASRPGSANKSFCVH